jgi:hypothetical protein
VRTTGTHCQKQDSTVVSAQAQSWQGAARIISRVAHLAGVLCACSRAHSKGRLWHYGDHSIRTGPELGECCQGTWLGWQACSEQGCGHTAGVVCSIRTATQHGHSTRAGRVVTLRHSVRLHTCTNARALLASQQHTSAASGQQKLYRQGPELAESCYGTRWACVHGLRALHTPF